MMNPKVTNLLYFAAGAAVGACGMFLGVKKYFELKADLEIESVRDAYNRRLAEMEGTKSSVEGDIKGPETIEDVGRMPTRSSISKELNNKPPLTDYSKYFKSDGKMDLDLKETIRDPKEEMIENELAEAEGPKDDEEMTEEEDEEATSDYEMYQINKDHQDALKEGRAPYVIDASDYELTCSHYSKIDLHYYISDGVVTTDEDEIVDIRSLLGNCIESSGFSDNGEDLLFVRNDITMADYEIEKLYMAFTDVK